ncbi:hypothetical protein K8P10_000870 [Leucobacter sp. Psy1]|nr:hypothetical protein K8P10_000870 [Leucobacter sp. Psy1]
MNWRDDVNRYLSRFGSRRTVIADLRAGLTLGIESVPDGLAAGVLAGVNPLIGLNAYIVGTFVGALTTGSVFMTVQATGAMSVIVAEAPEVHGANSAGALTTLVLCSGLTMLVLGIAGFGKLVRFIPGVVIIGFVNAVAVNIVLGQLENFTGYASVGTHRLTRLVDTMLSPSEFHWWSLCVGAVTIAVILALGRTPLGALSMVVGVLAGSVFATLVPQAQVATLSTIAEVTRSLPSLAVPDLSVIGALLVPACSLALVGLVQGAAISGSVANPDGRHPDPSADFRGQGLANIASGMLHGLPVGGSMSGTALARSAGAGSALTGVVASAVMVVTVFACGPLIGEIAMPALAALLIVVGVRSIKVHQLTLVWRTGAVPTAICAATFALTLLIPLQYAVLAGAGISVILFVARQSNRIRVVRWVVEPASDRPREVTPPKNIDRGETVVLVPYGSLFFASSEVFRQQLPTPKGRIDGAVVIIRLRGVEDLGVTFLTMIRGYAVELQSGGADLMIVGVAERLDEQLRLTGVAEVVGEENIFRASSRLGDSLREAIAEAGRRREW